jgi:hypothetical protein
VKCVRPRRASASPTEKGLYLRVVVSHDTDIDTEIGPETVTVYVDGDVAGTVDRDWWHDWTARIDNPPEECLASCLPSADGDLRQSLEG